jgi:hypothetical protein
MSVFNVRCLRQVSLTSGADGDRRVPHSWSLEVQVSTQLPALCRGKGLCDLGQSLQSIKGTFVKYKGCRVRIHEAVLGLTSVGVMAPGMYRTFLVFCTLRIS